MKPSARAKSPALLVAVLFFAAFATAATADIITVQQNIAFNKAKINPYGGGSAIEFALHENVFNESLGKARIPLFDQDIVGGPLRDIIPIELPDIARFTLSAGVAGNAYMDFGYYVTAGRLDLSYPANSSLNFHAVPGGDFVQANQRHRITTSFLPGVSQRTFASPSKPSTLNGAEFVVGGVSPDVLERITGYADQRLLPDGSGVTLSDWSTYSTPSFATRSPYAEAYLDAGVRLRADVSARVSALFGLIDSGFDFALERELGGTLVYMNTSGLWIAGEQITGFNLTDPIDVPLPGFGGSATLTYPNLAVGSGPPSTNGALSASVSRPVLTVEADLEKLIPAVGPFLHYDVGPIEITLAHLGGGPVIGLYQDMTFTPDPKVRLAFSEPVLVNDEYVTETTFRLGEEIEWRPMFSNSDEIIVSPTYILDNTFTNEIGIDLSLQTNVELLKFEAGFLGTVGPLYENTFTVPIGQIELGKPEFRVDLSDVNAGKIVIPKRNLDIVSDQIGDLKLSSYSFVAANPDGTDVYDLTFTRQIEGGSPLVYLAPGVTVHFDTVVYEGEGEGCGDGYCTYSTLEALHEVMVTDPITSEQFNLGRFFLDGNYDLRQFLPKEGFAYIDPQQPELGPLYVSDLPAVPDIEVDVETHPRLGQYKGHDFQIADDTIFPTETVDLRNSAKTTILARTEQLNPEADAVFGRFLYQPVIDNAGVALFSAEPDDAAGMQAPFRYGLYQADQSLIKKVVRSDELPELESIYSNQANDNGQVAISTPHEVFRSDPNALALIVRSGEPTPHGNGSFSRFYHVRMNNHGKVAFLADVLDVNANKRGLYHGDENGLSEIVRSGDTVPGFTNPLTLIADYLLNDRNRVAFIGENSQRESGFFIHDGTNLTSIAAKGENAPQNARFTYIQPFFGTAMNNVGQLTFVANVEPIQSPGTTLLGIFLGDGTQITQIARTGDSSPAGDGVFLNLFGPTLNEVGQVAFLAQLEDSSTGYDAVYRSDGQILTEIVRPSQPVRDENGELRVLSNPHGGVALSNEGHVAFKAFVENTHGDLEKGIFVHDGANVVQVARIGMSLAGSTIVGLNFESVGNSGLNDQMQVAYHATLADGREVIARFEPHLYWRNPGSGDWGMAENWSLRIAPHDPYDLFIIAEHALTVNGPVEDRTVNSLALGGPDTAPAVLHLAGGVSLTATNGTVICENGVLSGTGTLRGEVWNLGGTVSPGASPGVMFIDGNYVQDAAGMLLFEIGGPTPDSGYDVLDVAGSVLLAGDMVLAFADGYVPEPGTQFNLIRYDESFDASLANFHVLNAPPGRPLRPFVHEGVFGLVVDPVPEPVSLALLLFAWAMASTAGLLLPTASRTC